MKTKLTAVISVFFSIMLLCAVPVYAGEAPDAQLVNGMAGTAGYYLYNNETGEMTHHEAPDASAPATPIRQYTPDTVPSGTHVFPDAVIGEDNRYSLTPWGPYYTMCHILVEWYDGTYGSGTGFMVGRNSLVTAGHVVYNHSKGGSPREVKIFPAASYGDFPVGIYTAKLTQIGTGWLRDKNSNDDWATIMVDGTPGNSTGWLAMDGWEFRDVIGQFIFLAGYPDDRNNARGIYAPNYEMYHDVGTISSQYYSNSSLFCHDADATHGQSGSAIFGWRESTEYTIYGIHNGTGTNGYNVGVLINPTLYRIISAFAA